MDAITSATVIIAAFAVVQVGLEVSRRVFDLRAARMRAIGPAWLLRRTLDGVVSDAFNRDRVRDWLADQNMKEPLDRMEKQALEMLNEGSMAGPKEKKAAQEAFQHYLAYVDSLFKGNALLNIVHSDVTADLRECGEELLQHARDAIARLETLAPREAHENKPPSGRPKILLTPDKGTALTKGS